MKKYLKQVFCKHSYKRCYKTIGNVFLHESIWYYDDYQVDYCSKCGKEKQVNTLD